ARKTLIFLVSSILLRTLTVVFMPLKATIENQLPLNIQEKIFSEFVAGITKVLWAKPEKFIESSKFCQFLYNVSQTRGIHFVIDESHCILEFGHFRLSKLGQIKEEIPSALLLLLTATCSHQKASKLATILNRADPKVIRALLVYKSPLVFRTQSKPSKKKNIIKIIYKNLTLNSEGQAIIYSSTPNECIEIFNGLKEYIEPHQLDISWKNA
ncbi:1091_t:CDS:2, partial [Gigaspora rosea]